MKEFRGVVVNLKFEQTLLTTILKDIETAVSDIVVLEMVLRNERANDNRMVDGRDDSDSVDL